MVLRLCENAIDLGGMRPSGSLLCCSLVAAYTRSVPVFAYQHEIFQYQALRSRIRQICTGLRVAIDYDSTDIRVAS
eukprot:2539703-Rhodomonas_salina.4